MAIASPFHSKRFRDEDDIYPVSDGKPMAETAKHRAEMTYAIEALSLYLENRSDVWVSGNDFVYWERGNPRAVVSPDCYVVFGVERRMRDFYKAWEENGKLPDLVFECTSKKTRKEDTKFKLPLYEKTLKVAEYFQFDPTGDYLSPSLQGFRLLNGSYERIVEEAGRLRSEQLNLDLTVEEGSLRFIYPETGVKLLTYREQYYRNREEKQIAEKQSRIAEEERKRADNAESEIVRLRAELESLHRARD